VKFQKPVIVYNYPKGIKAFYMRLNDDSKTVAAMDVLVPKVRLLIIHVYSLLSMYLFWFQFSLLWIWTNWYLSYISGRGVDWGKPEGGAFGGYSAKVWELFVLAKFFRICKFELRKAILMGCISFVAEY
jgi:hypothetical protein